MNKNSGDVPRCFFFLYSIIQHLSSITYTHHFRYALEACNGIYIDSQGVPVSRSSVIKMMNSTRKPGSQEQNPVDANIEFSSSGVVRDDNGEETLFVQAISLDHIPGGTELLACYFHPRSRNFKKLSNKVRGLAGWCLPPLFFCH
jgi:hypothetical protein